MIDSTTVTKYFALTLQKGSYMS